ncbi:MAG: flagellin [Methanosarcinaceae archaeon]|nr:flagellin [Methanosarcinaceae archaeon]
MWNRFTKDEKGFTGLEAAIVLVAFVVVAAVFSYVMLGAGFYTTQKSQEVVHTGVMQASSSLEPSGDMIVAGAAGGNFVKNITMYITNTAGGSSVDLDQTIITYSDKDDFCTQGFDKAQATAAKPWNYTEVISDGGPVNLVEGGEKYKLEIDIENFIGITKTKPTINENIRLEIKPPEGAVLIIGRTMPAAIIENTCYAVY